MSNYERCSDKASATAQPAGSNTNIHILVYCEEWLLVMTQYLTTYHMNIKSKLDYSYLGPVHTQQFSGRRYNRVSFLVV